MALLLPCKDQAIGLILSGSMPCIVNDQKSLIIVLVVDKLCEMVVDLNLC